MDMEKILVEVVRNDGYRGSRMTIEIKCPVCRARNKLSIEKLVCRRCKSDLSTIYNLERSKRFFLLDYLIKIGRFKAIPLN